MANLNKKCICCSTRYSHCPDCSRADALKPSWASEFCSEICATLWMTLTRFGMNRLTKSEAKSIISELDLKSIESYVPCVQRDYAKVMAEEKKSKRGKRTEVQIMDEAIELPKEAVEELTEIKIEQPIEVVEPVEQSTEYEVIIKENE